MGSKIKGFLWTHRTDILSAIIVLLTVTAAFQLGRLSVMYGAGDELQIIETPQ